MTVPAQAAGSVVRLRRDDDIPAAAHALVTVHHTDAYPVENVSDPEAWLSPPGLLEAWVGQVDDRVVGHAAVARAADEAAVDMWRDRSGDPRERIALLARLFVHPDARGHALGRRLVETAMEYTRQDGLQLVLDVMTKDTAAIRLYERLGWTELGLTTHTFGAGHGVEAACYAAPTAEG